MSPELEALIKAAKTRADAMSPVEREAMHQAQRESWVRGETGMGETSAMMPPDSPTPSPDEIAELTELRRAAAGSNSDGVYVDRASLRRALAALDDLARRLDAVTAERDEVLSVVAGNLEAIRAELMRKP